MSNDSRENLHGIEDQEPADLTSAAGPANAQPTSASGAGASEVAASPAEAPLAAFPSRAPAAEPRPWYRSRRSFAAKGRGGRVQVAGLGVTYTDHESGVVLLAGIDLGFRAPGRSHRFGCADPSRLAPGPVPDDPPEHPGPPLGDRLRG